MVKTSEPDSAMPAQGITPHKNQSAPEMSIADLVSGLVTAKAAEELAKTERIRWEERVAERVGGPESGQETASLKDGTKITVTRGFNYKANCEAIQMLFRREEFDHSAPVVAKTTLKLDEKGYRWYEKTLPAVFRRIAEHVVATPKKIAVSLTAPKGGENSV